ncbi:MAG: nucleotidyltransferase domain-containing protein [Nitrospinae bacterium]|nr:nucleotidyltransferase domain-containing protein [Nitrospinota bacterium]
MEQALKENIVQKLKPLEASRILLFGSHASGNPQKDSDIDLLVIKKKVKSKLKDINQARKLLRKPGTIFDILVASEDEYDFYKNQIGSILCEIDRKGVVLYENCR